MINLLSCCLHLKGIYKLSIYMAVLEPSLRNNQQSHTEYKYAWQIHVREGLCLSLAIIDLRRKQGKSSNCTAFKHDPYENWQKCPPSSSSGYETAFTLPLETKIVSSS